MKRPKKPKVRETDAILRHWREAIPSALPCTWKTYKNGAHWGGYLCMPYLQGRGSGDERTRSRSAST